MSFHIDKEENSSLPERNFPLNSVNGSGETQDREEPLPLADLSVEACKANLHYYASKKELAFHAHKLSIIQYEESLTALNNALTQKYMGKR